MNNHLKTVALIKKCYKNFAKDGRLFLRLRHVLCHKKNKYVSCGLLAALQVEAGSQRIMQFFESIVEIYVQRLEV